MIFYVLAIAMAILAVAAVCARQILRAAVYLMGVLTLSAGLYLLLGLEFLAGVQVLVYVGGIVVLLVFAVMLTHSQQIVQDKPSLARRFFALLTALGFFASSLWVILQSKLGQELTMPTLTDLSVFNTATIGRAFLSAEGNGYLLPFELISLLLLAVLIAGIVIARREQRQ